MPRTAIFQRKGSAPPTGGGGPKMPDLPLPAGEAEGDPDAQAAMVAAAMDAKGAGPLAPNEPTGAGMTECPNCGCAFDPKDPVGTAVPPAGPPAGAAGPPGAPPMGPPLGGPGGGGPPPEIAAKLMALMSGAGGPPPGGPR